MIILCLISQSSLIGNLRSFRLTFSRQGIGDPGADKGSPEAGDGSGPQGRWGGGGAEIESDDAESETLINDSFRLFSSCQNVFQPERVPFPIT